MLIIICLIIVLIIAYFHFHPIKEGMGSSGAAITQLLARDQQDTYETGGLYPYNFRPYWPYNPYNYPFYYV